MAKAQSNVAPIQNYRDKFRANTLGSNSTRRTDTITIKGADGEPLPIVLKAPSLSGQELAQEVSGMEFVPGVDGKASAKIKNPLRYSVEMIILCCFVPEFGPNGEVTGPGQQMFTAADREALMQEKMSGWLKELSDAVTKFNDEKPKEAAKNSEATSSDASASA